MNPTQLKQIKTFNKRFLNKMLIHISGKKFGHFVILTHTGRKSGKVYRIPIIAEPFQDGFIVALTYGQNTDWFKNVMHSGSCVIRWKLHDYALVNPRLIDPKVGILAFPRLLRGMLRKLGPDGYLKLDIRNK